MNMRRLILVGGAICGLLAVLLIPSGSGAAFTNSQKYDGTLKGSAANGGTLNLSNNQGICTINGNQFVGLMEPATGGRNTSDSTHINYTVTATGGSTPVVVATGSLDSFNDTDDLGGTVVPCDATGFTVTFQPRCVKSGVESDCGQADSVTAGRNFTYVSP